MDVWLSLVFIGVTLAFLGLAMVINYPVFSNFTEGPIGIGMSMFGIGFTLIPYGFKPHHRYKTTIKY